MHWHSLEKQTYPPSMVPDALYYNIWKCIADIRRNSVLWECHRWLNHMLEELQTKLWPAGNQS